jgi:hypothetical protein
VGIRAPDVHRRALPDGFQPLENLDVFACVVGSAVAVADAPVRPVGHNSPIHGRLTKLL